MEIAGYRVVREVRSDAERSVFAVFGERALQATVGHDRELVADEAAALASLSHVHIAAILDVATVDGEPVVFRSIPERTLADWMIARGSPLAGEVATIIIPIVHALAHAHDRGVTGLRLDMHSIVVDDDGCPVLIGVGARQATESVTPQWLRAAPEVLRDRAALRALCNELLLAAGQHLPESMEVTLESGDLSSLASAVQATWPPVPLQFDVRVDAPRSTRQTRVRPERRLDGLGAFLDRALVHVRRVRRGVWLAGACGVVALVVSAVLLAQRSDAAPAVAREETHAGAETVLPSLNLGADEAAEAMMVQLAHCDGVEVCVQSLVDPGIGVLDAQSIDWVPTPEAQVTVASTMGDVVLVDVADSQPASILLVRTEAGWMLRGLWPAT